jgi:transcriptional regulator with XRE-family HTH domain
MVNSEHFAQRLQKILEFYDISAATFAEAIDVGRSSISHILSGRNKPSLDFVMKVVQNYPEVELYWLLNGKGSFPPQTKKNAVEKVSETDNVPKDLSSPTLQRIPDSRENEKILKEHGANRVKKVILIYEDGSFEAFEN